MTDHPDILKAVTVAFVAVLLFTATVAKGQEELDAFVVAYLEVRVLQSQLDERLHEVLERADLGATRFREIHEKDLDPATERELTEYRDLRDRMLGIRDEFRKRMVGAVESVEMSVERFDAIVVDLLSDPEVAQAVEARIEELVASRKETTDSGSAGREPGE